MTTIIRAAALAATTLLAACLSNTDREIRADDFGDDWPFTVANGRVNCFKGGYALVFKPDGRMSYALNGGAKADGYPAIDPIWRDNPDAPGTKINLLPAIEAAKDICR